MSNLSDYQNTLAQRDRLAKRDADRKAAHERLSKPSKENEGINAVLRSRGPDTITMADRPDSGSSNEFFNAWVRSRAANDPTMDPLVIEHEKKLAEKGKMSTKMESSILRMDDGALEDIVDTKASPGSVMGKAKAVASKELARRKRRNADG